MTSFILVALDGLRPDMVNATATPNLAALAAWNNVCQCAQRLPIADAGGHALAHHWLPARRAWHDGEHAVRCLRGP